MYAYYVNETTVLRSHTSAHQNQLLGAGHKMFLVSGDVYRKDEINSHHYNIFHQMEGVCLVDDGIDAMDTLKTTLEGLIKYLFPNCNYRFMADSFTFTDPSLQAEVEFNGKWLEILGGGKIHHEILKAHNIQKQGWAFGLGLERLAMVLFEIPDIRLLWSTDPKFTDQFKSQTISTFKPFSKLNSITRDIAFWLNNTEIIENEVH